MKTLIKCATIEIKAKFIGLAEVESTSVLLIFVYYNWVSCKIYSFCFSPKNN